MSTPILEAIENAITKYVLARCCTQVWLGYAEALFLGLSDEGLPDRTAARLCPGRSREKTTAALRKTLRDGGNAEERRRLLLLQRQELRDPPSEIQTHFADWVLKRDEVLGSNCDERTIAQGAICQLLGRCVMGVVMSTDAMDLTLVFDGGYELKISEVRQFDASCIPAPDAWMLRSDKGIYYGVRCDGTVVMD